MTQDTSTVEQAREAVPVIDAAAEYEAFCVWSRNQFPKSAPPSPTSHIFDAWLASARHRIAALAKPASPNALVEPGADEAVLYRDEARLALFNAIRDIKIGNPTDDRLILGNLAKQGVGLCRLSALSSPRPVDEVREALRPFAVMTELIEPGEDDNYKPDWSPFISVSRYRRAAQALASLEGVSDGK